ncbi:uncharacterized protein LOC117116634 [Anneissia japonica]|uniref:uncharacterized protein LOC117116634 n=1 Tax=Anneissia japonica TaxID=1529436 RepID=UPI001425585F|nr:uncharacterized protein LOC117116634 [Anneissia japonica]
MTEFKYVLLEFFDEDPPSVDIGMTEWIDEEITESNYETWIGEEVLCAWHSAGGSKKRPDVTRCAAKIICFGGDRAELAKKRNVYVTTGQLNNFTTPLGKGNRKRKPKRFYDALASDDDDDSNDIEASKVLIVTKKKFWTEVFSQLKN